MHCSTDALWKFKINDKDSIKTSFPNFIEILKNLELKLDNLENKGFFLKNGNYVYIYPISNLILTFFLNKNALK